MKITTTNYTNYSNSAVAQFTNSNGFKLAVALNKNGEIYRLVRYGEILKIGETVTIELGEISAKLIAEWHKSNNPKIYKLEDIQKVHVLFFGGTISNNPLYEIDINNYYECSKIIELHNEKESLYNTIEAQRTEITSLKQQLLVVQAKLKVPSMMAAKGCNDKKALAFILAGKKLESHLTELFKNKIVHPNNYTGSGRYTSKGADNAAAIIKILEISHIKHTIGNDAIKGGFSGNFIKIK